MLGDRLLRLAHHLFILLLVVVSTLVLSAQVVVDPHFVEFNASPDHDLLSTDGQPLVSSYSMSIYTSGGSTPIDTINLGKPTPVSGIIRVDFIPLLHAAPPTGVNLEARVIAVGPGGTTPSSTSNGFTFQAPCAPGIAPTSLSAPSGGTTGSVTVTAGTGCAWSATTNAAWITLTGTTSGTGNGSVPYSVAANTTISQRTGTLTIAGQTFTVTQAGLSCSYSLNPTSQSIAAAGATGSTAVSALAGCAWTAVSNDTSWLTITSGTSGNGNGTVNFSATANPNGTQRSGTLTIGGQTFSVTQAAATCSYSIAPTGTSIVSGGATGSTAVTAPGGCAWTAVSNDTSWLTITSGASGSGNGTVNFSATANPNASQRSGTLTIGGQTFTVTQAAATCSYALNPTSQSIAAAGATGSTAVSALAGCAWTAVSNNTSWLTITSGTSGNGNGTVNFSATANPNASQRSGTLTIGGQTFTVTQAAATCSYSIAPTGTSIVSGGATGSTAVTAPGGCAWTAVSNDTSWLTITSGASGTGNGTVNFSATANPNGTQRTGTLTIGGQTFSVTQAAATCSYSIAPTGTSIVSGSATGSTAVTAPGGCAWTAVSNDTSWLTITSGASGNGNGTVNFSATANPNASQRSGTLTIAGQTFTVTQAAATCSYSLNPTSQSIVAAGATGSTAVSALAGCAWTAVSNNTSWLTITGGASGSGNGTVNFSATANPNGTQRSGTLTIGGQTFTVTQAAAPCTYSIAPTGASVAFGGGTGSTAMTAPSGCSWTAVSNDTSWLTITSGASGSGNGTVNFSATANPNSSQRTGTLTIGGQTFTVTEAGAPCSYSIAPTGASVVFGGGTGSTVVTAPGGCAWTGVSNDTSWLTITSGASGSGNGSVNFSVTPNPNSSQRSGTLTIAGQTFTVTQAAAPCTYSVAPTSASLAFGAATGSTAVTAPGGCSWTAVSNATSWLTITSGASGTGNGTVNFSATANPNSSQRSGTLTIGGQTFTVTQAAAPCTYSLAPTSASIVFGGATGSTAVTAPGGCAWTAVSNDTSWLTITSGGSGSGNGTVNFSATANPNSSQRTGTLTIGGQTFTVTEAGAPCTFSLTPGATSVAAAGGTGSTTVGAPGGCAWTAVSNDTGWLTITAGTSGTGGGTVSFSAIANPNASQRAGTLTIAAQTFTVTQAAAGCTFTLTPTSTSVVAGGGTGSVTVTAPGGCSWTGVSNATSWLSVTSGATGSGNGSVGFSATANPNASQRTGTLTIGAQTFTVTQAAATCSYSIAPTTASIVATGGTGSTAVTAPGGCSWTGVSNNTSWLTVTNGATGTGNGTVGFSATANPNASQRTGTLTIGGQTFTVTQPAATCTYSIAPTTASIVATGGTGSTAVTSPGGCAWTGVSNDTSWLTVTSGASGSGNGTVNFSATANANGSQRTGTLTIGGQTFTVTQAAATCTYSLAPASVSIATAGGTGSTAVTAPTGCAWTGVSNDTSWLTITGAANGSGNGSVSYTATANPNASQRVGTLTIGGQAFTVTQAPAGCSFSISPNSQSPAAAATTGSTTVTTGAGCQWTATSNASWITFGGASSGTGSGPLSFNIAANPNGTQRIGTLTIAGQTYTVTQAAAACTFSISPSTSTVTSAGGSGSSTITATPGCSWTAASNVAWISVTSGASGTGNGSTAFSVASYTGTTDRTGTLTIAGRTFTVTQSSTCVFTLVPDSRQANKNGDTGIVSVSVGTGCTWTPSTTFAWISVTGGATGSGQVNYTIEPNATAIQRTGTIAIGNKTFTITQVGGASPTSPRALKILTAGGGN